LASTVLNTRKGIEDDNNRPRLFTTVFVSLAAAIARFESESSLR